MLSLDALFWQVSKYHRSISLRFTSRFDFWQNSTASCPMLSWNWYQTTKYPQQSTNPREKGKVHETNRTHILIPFHPSQESKMLTSKPFFRTGSAHYFNWESRFSHLFWNGKCFVTLPGLLNCWLARQEDEPLQGTQTTIPALSDASVSFEVANKVGQLSFSIVIIYLLCARRQQQQIWMTFSFSIKATSCLVLWFSRKFLYWDFRSKRSLT